MFPSRQTHAFELSGSRSARVFPFSLRVATPLFLRRTSGSLVGDTELQCAVGSCEEVLPLRKACWVGQRYCCLRFYKELYVE